MTPRKLHALADVHADVHSDSTGKHKSSTRKASSNPAADLAALGAVGI